MRTHFSYTKNFRTLDVIILPATNHLIRPAKREGIASFISSPAKKEHKEKENPHRHPCLSRSKPPPSTDTPTTPIAAAAAAAACLVITCINPMVSSLLGIRFPELKASYPSATRGLRLSLRLCSVNGSGEAYNSSDSEDTMPNNQGAMEKNEAKQQSLSSNELMKRLRRYGISGILSYGLLNTVYYLTAFLLVWFYVAPAPGKMGYFAAVERFFKVMAMVWAGSQVTKLARAGGALALAPIVDRGLSWFTVKFKFESQGKAFMAIVAFCFGLAVILFLVITFLWA